MLFSMRARIAKSNKRKGNRSKAISRNRSSRRIRNFEHLEDRRVMAIIWANQATSNLGATFQNNATIATQIVNRAINDWNKVITDFNYDGDNSPTTNNTYNLSILGGDLGVGGRGLTQNVVLNANHVPTSATITLDDNGGGQGWFLDSTPLDDAEFTAVANSAGNGISFEGSFVDVSGGATNFNDLYRTITHEIGHALGIRLVEPTFGLNSGNWLIQNQVTGQTYSLATDTTDDALGQLTYVGIDQITPTRTVTLFDPNTQRNDPFTVVNELWQSPFPDGVATFTEDGGGHLYEGNVNDPVGLVVHPNELMNSGRAVPPPGGNPLPTVRQFISNLDIQLLADSYGYTVNLPSTLDTAQVTLDYQTGVLLVQGRARGATGVGFDDTINITTEGVNNSIIKVVINANTPNEATERIDTTKDFVSRIVIAGNGGNDTQSVTGLSGGEKGTFYLF